MSGIAGYRLMLNADSGATNLIGQTGTRDGVIDVLMRTDSSEVYIGGYNVAANLPASGYKLMADKEYHFTAVTGDFQLATTAVDYIYVHVLLTPKL